MACRRCRIGCSTTKHDAKMWLGEAESGTKTEVRNPGPGPPRSFKCPYSWKPRKKKLTRCRSRQCEKPKSCETVIADFQLDREKVVEARCSDPERAAFFNCSSLILWTTRQQSKRPFLSHRRTKQRIRMTVPPGKRLYIAATAERAEGSGFMIDVAVRR